MTDPLADIVRFADALRDAGVVAGADRVATAVEALAVMGRAGVGSPYWPLRVAFCTREADLPIFEMVFRGWFGGSELVDAAERPPQVGTGTDGGQGAAADDGDGGAGNAAGLATRDFETLTEAELTRIKAWMRLLAPAPRSRPAMRHAPAHSGRIDVARTVGLLLRNHGELSSIRFSRRLHRPRRLLLLVDVSGSMRPYSDMLLHFAHAALAAGPRTTEVFAVGTRPTRLTEELRAREPDDAMRAMAAVAADWNGGTTLGVALQDFLRREGGRNVVRSAVVVLGSDGFEFADQSLLRQQTARLAQLAEVLIWVDPLRRSDDYTPADRNLAAAQSYATVRLPGHSFEALRELAKVISR